jgi:predicted TIM-barrel fold metal-dependent hydrolase
MKRTAELIAVLGAVEARMSTLRPETRRKVLGENAATLYRLT